MDTGGGIGNSAVVVDPKSSSSSDDHRQLGQGQGQGQHALEHGQIVFADEFCSSSSLLHALGHVTSSSNSNHRPSWEGRYVRLTGQVVSTDEINENRIMVADPSDPSMQFGYGERRLGATEDYAAFSTKNAATNSACGGGLSRKADKTSTAVAVDIQWIDPNLIRVGSLYQFWGYLSVDSAKGRGGASSSLMEALFVKVKVVRNVDGLDMSVFRQAIMLQRRYLKKCASV